MQESSNTKPFSTVQELTLVMYYICLTIYLYFSEARRRSGQYLFIPFGLQTQFRGVDFVLSPWSE